MPKLPQILKIEPPEALSFKGPFTEVVTSTLTLRNPSEQRVAFKVKTTAPKRYCVRPNSGLLNKDESVTVSVMLQPFEFDPAEKNKHKFMIQSLIASGDAEEKDVWKDAEPDKLMDTKLRVVFDAETTTTTTAAVPTAPVTQGKPAHNDLDTTGDPVQMTPQKANLKVASKPSDDEIIKAREENARLQKEVETLKEESQRLRRIAMSDTMSTSGSQKAGAEGSQQQATGISLLFQDSTNIIILIILFIATFTAGLILSDNLLR